MASVRRPQLGRFPASLFAATVAFEVAAIALSWGVRPSYDTVLYAVYVVTLAGAGALIASRHPANAIGWLFCATALFTAVFADIAQGWGRRAAENGWPGGTLGEWIALWSWIPSGLAMVLTFVLFPDGRPLRPAWFAVAWVNLVGVALAAPGWAVSAELGPDFIGGRNPFAVDSRLADVARVVGTTLFLGSFVAAFVPLGLRFGRSRGVERQQLKWFAFAAACTAVILPLGPLLWNVTPIVRPLVAVALTALPVAACIAILRYRLYDIDTVINRTVVYGIVTVLLAATFGLTILLLGTALGRGSAWATAGATLAAAAAFRPLRERVQHTVDRRFNRTRYDALRRMAGFLEDLRAGRVAPEQVVTVLREVTTDPELDLHFFLPESQLYVDSSGRIVPERDGDTRGRVVIERNGQPLAVLLHGRAGQEHPVLLRRVVDAGALAVEIARLRVELRRQLAEVEASRARIIAAGNEERRRIERDLHDGAQPRLVSIGLALRHAQHQLSTSTSAEANRTLDGAVAEVAVAIEQLRELARGLPPAQLDAGLAPAFHELARRAPLPVQVKAPNERFDRGVEAAAYYIGCEGLTNALKHAHATRIVLSAGRQNGNLIVSVADDGIGGAAPAEGGGLTGLSDRVVSLGGTLHIDTARGRGTTLTVKLPCG